MDCKATVSILWMRRDPYHDSRTVAGPTRLHADSAAMAHRHLGNQREAEAVMPGLFVCLARWPRRGEPFKRVLVHSLGKARTIIDDPDDGLPAALVDLDIYRGFRMVKRIRDQRGEQTLHRNTRRRHHNGIR